MRFSLATISIFVILLVGDVQTLAAPLNAIRSDGLGGLSNDLTLRALNNKATVAGPGLQVLKVAPKKIKAPKKTTTKKTTKPAKPAKAKAAKPAKTKTTATKKVKATTGKASKTTKTATTAKTLSAAQLAKIVDKDGCPVDALFECA